MILFDELYERFRRHHADIGKAVEGLPVEALDWVPGKDMNSINVLVVHSLGAEQRLIGSVALDEPPSGKRDEEFTARGLSADGLKQRLAASDDFLLQALPRISLADLDMIHTIHETEQRSVAWILLHALEHTALHLGHIQITRQLWDQKAK
jgi:hypothetical protein